MRRRGFDRASRDKEKSCGVRLPNGHPADVGLVAIFLRDYVRVVLISDAPLVVAQRGPGAAIKVAFMRTPPEPLDLVEITGEHPFETQAGEVIEASPHLEVHMNTDDACGVHTVSSGVKEGSVWNGRRIGTIHNKLMSSCDLDGSISFSFQLCRSRNFGPKVVESPGAPASKGSGLGDRPRLHAVVVRWGTKRVESQRAVQERTLSPSP